MKETACVIITDRTNERGSGTCPRRSDRLVEPLPSGIFVKVSSDEGLAG
jgi:hypothetical protein